MKKITYILVITLLCINSSSLLSQNSLGKSNDEERIAIGIGLSDESSDIPEGSLNMLSNRLSQAASLNGLSAESEAPIFNIIPEASVISKQVTSTAPPMISIMIELSLKVVDKYEGNSFGQVTYTIKGVGKTEEAAYSQAFRRVNARDPKLKSFFTKSKAKILEYYNSKCDFIISKANGYINAGQYNDAYNLLINVPSVCRECYDECMNKIDEFANEIDVETNRQETNNNTEVTSEKEIELANGLIVKYLHGRVFGEDLILYLSIINPTNSEKEITIDNHRNACYFLNNSGERIELKTMKVANQKERWEITYDILPGTPVELRLNYPSDEYVRQLNLMLNDNVYKLENLSVKK